MREVVEIAPQGIAPEPEEVLAGLGYPPGSRPAQGVASLVRSALSLLEREASPRGLLAEVTREEFARIYRGAGANEPDTPLAAVFPRAGGLALFAVTIGEAVSERITGLFAARDYALAAALDAAASRGAERAGDAVERRYLGRLGERGEIRPGTTALRYSPGYCGWHVSGQGTLFQELRPGEIGISLRESFLMEPLKSMSGVIVAGPAEIHDFEAAFPFCSLCETRGCRERIRGLARG